jgi:hypothetical protein
VTLGVIFQIIWCLFFPRYLASCLADNQTCSGLFNYSLGQLTQPIDFKSSIRVSKRFSSRKFSSQANNHPVEIREQNS